MQPARNQAMILAFDRDLDPVTPSGCGCDRVGALDRDASRRDMKCQELTGQIIEWDPPSTWRSEPERLHVVSHIFHLRERQLAHPPNPSGGRIVLLVRRRAMFQL